MLGKFSATKQHPQTFVDYETDSHYVAQDVLEFSISQPLIFWDSTIANNENCMSCFEDQLYRKQEGSRHF